jgi:hypothetical protein
VGTAVAVVIAVLVVVGAGVTTLVVRKRRAAAALAEAEANRSRTTIAPSAPMTGLESALDQVADRSGTKLRQKLEAEAAIVDDLRVADDTGPLLRRALDRVEHPNDPSPPPAG